MTRSSQVAHALSAMKDERATRARSEQAWMKFRIFEDNGGDYCWTLLAAGGERLAQSMRFASYQEAARAACIARAGAASAPIEDHTADIRTVDRAARRKDRDQTRRPGRRTMAGRRRARQHRRDNP